MLISIQPESVNQYVYSVCVVTDRNVDDDTILFRYRSHILYKNKSQNEDIINIPQSYLVIRCDIVNLEIGTITVKLTLVLTAKLFLQNLFPDGKWCMI